MKTLGVARRGGAVCLALFAISLTGAEAQTVTRVEDARAGTDGSAPSLFRYAGGSSWLRLLLTGTGDGATRAARTSAALWIVDAH